MNLLGQAGPFAKAGRLIVTIAAAVTDPTGLSAAGAGIDAYLTAHDTLTRDNPDLAKLAKELSRDLESRLKNPTFHRPNNADTLLPQMIEAALPQPTDFTDTALDPAAIITLVLSRLTEPAHQTPAIADAFRALYLPVLTTALNDPRMIAALQPAIQRKMLQGQTNLAQKLDTLATLPRDALELLASRFEIATPHALSDAELQNLLTQKAQEYRIFRDQIEALDDRVAAIANLKGAAQDAADRLDFEEVETLLSRVDQVETEIAAATKITRAHNALLRNRTQQAFDILTAAADSFASVGQHEQWRSRNTGAKLLYNHALSFGGKGAYYAVKMWEKCLTEVDRHQRPNDWLGAHLNIAMAILRDALGLEPTECIAALNRSKGLAQIALESSTKSTPREIIAGAHLSLANTTNYLIGFAPFEDKQNHFNFAVSHYENAIKVFLGLGDTENYIGSLSSFGQFLSGQSEQFKADLKLDYLERSLTCFDSALKALTQSYSAELWAMTQFNRGKSLFRIAELTRYPACNEIYDKATTAFQDALDRRGKTKEPLQWLKIRRAMAVHELSRANRPEENGQQYLDAAQNHVDQSLSVIDPATMTLEHLAFTKLRDDIRAALASRAANS